MFVDLGSGSLSATANAACVDVALSIRIHLTAVEIFFENHFEKHLDRNNSKKILSSSHNLPQVCKGVYIDMQVYLCMCEKLYCASVFLYL